MRASILLVILLAQDYPQWRGPNRDGSASGFVEPKSWPEKLTRRWKVDLGEGYATPIVVGNRVYEFTRREGREIMTAVNAADGTVVWQTGYPARYEMAQATEAHGEGPKSTPLFYRGKLYTLGISGIVSAFDASTGKLVWQKPAPSTQPYFGTACSAIGEGDVVILHPGNYESLTAFDAETGNVRWTSEGEGAYASPIIAEFGGARQIVTMARMNVIGVSISDGAVLWKYPWPPRPATDATITPIVYDGMILVSGDKTGLAAIRPAMEIGKWTARLVWQTQEVSMFLSNPVIVNGTLFGMSERASGQFFALDAATGKVLWLGPPREATNTAVVKAANLLFLLKDDGQLIVARANRSGFEPLKRYTVADQPTWAQPAIIGNRIFIKDTSSLALWSLE